MMPPLRSFDGVDGRERGQKKTDDLRAMTTLGPRTLYVNLQQRNDTGLTFDCTYASVNLQFAEFYKISFLMNLLAYLFTVSKQGINLILVL